MQQRTLWCRDESHVSRVWWEKLPQKNRTEIVKLLSQLITKSTEANPETSTSGKEKE
jgi:hypothetical protein